MLLNHILWQVSEVYFKTLSIQCWESMLGAKKDPRWRGRVWCVSVPRPTIALNACRGRGETRHPVSICRHKWRGNSLRSHQDTFEGHYALVCLQAQEGQQSQGSQMLGGLWRQARIQGLLVLRTLQEMEPRQSVPVWACHPETHAIPNTRCFLVSVCNPEM